VQGASEQSLLDSKTLSSLCRSWRWFVICHKVKARAD
jgi:hypothetical protein